MRKKTAIGQRGADGLGKKPATPAKIRVHKAGTKVLLFKKEIPGYAGLGEKLC